jgi:hypothetical protein
MIIDRIPLLPDLLPYLQIFPQGHRTPDSHRFSRLDLAQEKFFGFRFGFKKAGVKLPFLQGLQ